MTERIRNGGIVFAILIVLVGAEILENRPPKFQVLRAHAEDVEQLKALREIHARTQHDLDFWQTPSKVGHRADIMVDEDRMKWLDTVLKGSNISYDVIIDDVQKLILDKEHGPSRRSKLNFSKRMQNEGGNRARYPFGEYHSYQTILDWMRDIERKYPDRAKTFTMGTTEEGRRITGIKIGSQVWRTDKKVFWIDGGIHAREWAAVHTTLWFIDRLIADYDDDPLVRAAVDRLNFYILPVANPDGYEYSRSDVSPMIRLWRKNRAGVVCKKDRWFRDRCCGGVDLNRNYDWHFGETGSSTDKCSEIYQGVSAFSELESRSMRDFLTSPEMNGKLEAFITLHTYSQMWIHPYSHERKKVPADIAELQRVGRAAVAALENTFGTKYKFGTGSDILYPSAGGSDDWAKGFLRAKYVYLLELRPGEDVWDGFILDQHQLIPTAKETWNGVKVVIKAATEHGGGRGGGPRVLPAFVRRPNGSVVRTNARRPGSFVRRPAAFSRNLPFRNRGSATGGQGFSAAPRLQPTAQSSRNCSDRSAWCGSWLSSNPRVCQISSIYMRQDCARTCGFCR